MICATCCGWDFGLVLHVACQSLENKADSMHPYILWSCEILGGWWLHTSQWIYLINRSRGDVLRLSLSWGPHPTCWFVGDSAGFGEVRFCWIPCTYHKNLISEMRFSLVLIICTLGQNGRPQDMGLNDVRLEIKRQGICSHPCDSILSKSCMTNALCISFQIGAGSSKSQPRKECLLDHFCNWIELFPSHFARQTALMLKFS